MATVRQRILPLVAALGLAEQFLTDDERVLRGERIDRNKPDPAVVG